MRWLHVSHHIFSLINWLDVAPVVCHALNRGEPELCFATTWYARVGPGIIELLKDVLSAMIYNNKPTGDLR